VDEQITNQRGIMVFKEEENQLGCSCYNGEKSDYRSEGASLLSGGKKYGGNGRLVWANTNAKRVWHSLSSGKKEAIEPKEMRGKSY